jgi:hypothetical protein
VQQQVRHLRSHVTKLGALGRNATRFALGNAFKRRIMSESRC